MYFLKIIILVMHMLTCVVVCDAGIGLSSDDSYTVGSGAGDVDCNFNMTRLERIVQNAVDRKIEELRAKFLTRANSGYHRDIRPSPRPVADCLDKVKGKFKSMEFRMFKLSKELESTKIALVRQTAVLERTVTATRSNLSPIYDTTQQHRRLEKVVSQLASRLDKLASFVIPELDPLTRTENLSEVPLSVSQTRPDQGSYPTDCDAAYRSMGRLLSGEFHVKILPAGTNEPFMAQCRVFNHTGWTLVQRRFNGSVDFYRPWADYRDGFGSTEGEFWLGNQNIYHLTKQGQMSLRVELQDWEGGDYYAQYDNFRIGSEDELFRLHINGYHGTAGDSLTSTWESHDGHAFSTHDRDNDARFYDNCSEHFQGAWWFNSCFTSHLNGKYFQKGNHKNYFIRNGIQWNTLHSYSSLKSSAMMLGPRKVK